MLDGIVGRLDDGIDQLVDKLLVDYDSDTPADFESRIEQISGKAQLLMRAFVGEQIAMEKNPERKAKLEVLRDRLKEIKEEEKEN